MMKNHTVCALRTCLLSLPLLWASGANAAPIPWVGTADYSVGANGVVSGDTVTDFHSYDIGPGAALLHNNAVGGSVLAPTVGDIIQGYTQSYISGHLDIGGTGVVSPNLNQTGSGGGYELTLRADFQDQITSASPSAIGFDVISGSWEIYLDGTPDYSFSGDSGFTDGAAILAGTILQGAGTANIFDGSAVFGVSTLDLLVTSFDASIFDPDTIQAGSSVFTLQLGLGSPVNFNSVQGHTASTGDLMLTADGNVEINAVPIPPTVWLIGSGLLGLVGIARRKKA